MSTFVDGPAAGRTLALQRAPIYLRLVYGLDGKWDALDQVDDQPDPGETVHVYRRTKYTGKALVRLGGRLGCVWMHLADYRWMAEIDGETLRDNPTWQAWTRAQLDERFQKRDRL